MLFWLSKAKLWDGVKGERVADKNIYIQQEFSDFLHIQDSETYCSIQKKPKYAIMINT